VVPLSIGTDTGGSIRIPAAFNGLVGYRPTIGHYGQAGIQALAPSFDTVGPLAQTVSDIRLFDEVFSGRSNELAAAPVLAYDHAFLAGLPIQAEVWAGFLAAIERLRQAGLEIENRPLEVWRDAFTLVTTRGWPGSVEAYQTHRGLLATPEAERLDPRVHSRLLLTSGRSADHHAQVMARRAELIGRMETEMNVLMLTPTVALTAPALSAVERDEDFARLNLDTLRFTMIGSLLDQPGVTLPAGVDSAGLPYGLLLSAPRGHDARVLGAALQVEQRLTPG
jgi:aspartyl-tRNA(Asn)/glutamyl-tRNA(Gln) amidotransferase subunit A